MGLTEYRRKRDFKRTPEPAGAPAAPRRRADPIFVVQKHDASRLHYDFRLEHAGVLKSWAVPKGPSLDPKERNLAVQVEDHPVPYAAFEGTIPKGQYGGGTVMLWDRGTWEPEGDPDEGLRRGKLDFSLRGEKLRGAFTLVRMSGRGRGRGGDEGKNWLLIKRADEHARPRAEGDVREDEPTSVATGRTLEQIASANGEVWNAKGAKGPKKTPTAKSRKSAAKPGPRAGNGASNGRTSAKRGGDPMPRDLEPELATLAREAPAGTGWVHEVKFDGYRMLAYLRKGAGKSGGSVRLVSRRGNDWTHRFKAVADALAGLGLGDCVVDGEVVALDDKGVSDFQTLQLAMKLGKKARLAFYAFDLLYHAGRDLRKEPLVERKRVLESVLPRGEAGTVRYSAHLEGVGDEVMRNACRLGLEGIVCKRAASPYRSGRHDDWLKVKCVNRQEFVIGGWTDPQRSREHLGALLVGYHDGGALKYAGKVGTGYTTEVLAQLRTLLEPLERDDSPFADPPTGYEARGAHWARPEAVAEIEFTEWTSDGMLRHPVFKGLREDKKPSEIVRERPAGGSATDEPRARATGAARPAPSEPVARARGSSKRGAEATVAGVRLSNPDKVLYPDQGVTKGELAAYYEAVAEWVLPHVANRPLTIVRCPSGRGGSGHCFVQKHLKDAIPEHVRGVRIREKSGPDVYFVVDDLPGLVSLVQLGTLELHPWGATADAVESPDRLIFDLDPGPGISWDALVDAALLIRERLEGRGLRSFPKTSGGKGVHVVVPIAPGKRAKPGPTWDDVREFTGGIAEEIAREEPGRYVATMTKARRGGRVFIDYLRNGRGATAVAAYSTRAREGATVSTPLTWDELTKGVRPADFTVRTVPARLRRKKKDPWEGFFTLKQRLP